MMKKFSWINTCSKCGEKYHVSSPCCPACELEEYWREMAKYHQGQARKCLETANLIAAEKAGGAV